MASAGFLTCCWSIFKASLTDIALSVDYGKIEELLCFLLYLLTMRPESLVVMGLLNDNLL